MERPHPLPFFDRLEGETAHEHLRRLLRRGPAADAPARWGAASRLVRQAAERLNRHALRYQQAVAEALFAALREAEARADRQADALADQGEDLAARASAGEARLAGLEVRTAGLAAGLARLAEAHPAAPDAAWWQARLARLFAEEAAPLPPVVELPTDVGPLLFPADDRVITPFVREYGWWEKQESAELRALLRPGMTFVDIGAHVGYLTVVAAEAVGPGGRGVAVEPAAPNHALLRANLLRHNLGHVEAIHAAAWDRTGAAALRMSTENSGDHRVAPWEEDGDGAAVSVTALALDDVIPPTATVDVVKVDAQGTDHLAIRGMERTLARCRSVLLVEFWPSGIEEHGDDPLAVLRYYGGLGYDLRVLGDADGGPPRTPEAVVDAALALDCRYCTLLLRPR